MNAQIRQFKLTAPGQQDDALDDVVTQLAQIERRLERLRDKDLRASLEENDEAISPDDLEKTLHHRRVSLQLLASDIQARTREGVVLQALIALIDVLPAMEDTVTFAFNQPPAGRHYREHDARARRLLYSIAYADDDISEDLQLLREKMAGRRWHPILQADAIDKLVPLQVARG